MIVMHCYIFHSERFIGLFLRTDPTKLDVWGVLNEKGEGWVLDIVIKMDFIGLEGSRLTGLGLLEEMIGK